MMAICWFAKHVADAVEIVAAATSTSSRASVEQSMSFLYFNQLVLCVVSLCG